MVTEPNSIATMKEFYGDRLHVSNEADLQAELMEGNDRSTIITIAAICDSALEARIAQSLPGLKGGSKKDADDAFRHDGGLGTFSAKISVAFYMGLIDERTRKQLTDLRHIRNAVAHTRRRVSLADPQLRNAVKRILHPVGMYRLLNDTPDGYLRTFIVEGLLLSNIVDKGREEAVAKQRAVFVDAGRPDPFR